MKKSFSIVNTPPSVTLGRLEQLLLVTDSKAISHWQVNGTFCATKAYLCYSEGDNDSAIEWSELGIRIFELLFKNEQKSSYKDSEMRIRANAIVFFGECPDVDLLNPSVIESWFLEELPGEIDDIKKLVTESTPSDLYYINVLVPLEERLKIIDGLINRKVFQKNTQINEWKQLFRLFK